MNYLKIIKNTGIIAYLFFNQSFIYASQTLVDSTAIIKILPSHNKEYVFTKHTISVIKKGKPLFLSTIESEIKDVIEYRDSLWIGTTKGLYTYDIKNAILQKSSAVSDNLNISKVKVDAEGSFWIASINNGLWRLKKNKADKLLDVSPIYSLEVSSDTAVWAGSNIGLYKLNRRTNSWQRYAEEGYSGYEIPDNIVENLFCDLHNNMWVIMPDEFAFISSQNYDGHIPGFRNVVAQDFELKFITEITNNQYMIVTSKGIFLMPNSPSDNHQESHEVKAGPEQKMYLLTNQQLLLNKNLDTKYITTASKDIKGNLLLSYNNVVYCVKKKTIKNIINDLNKL
ncbi:MAG: hypothetical protein ABI315_09565 [Bacteroidia bacterium]